MNTLTKAFLALSALAALGFGQATMTQTTLPAAITARQTSFQLASVTGVNAPGQPVANGAIDAPTGSNVTILYVDKEAMRVQVAPNGTTVTVLRGTDGTESAPHASGATVWVGPSSYYWNSYQNGQGEPTGTCTATLLPVLPVISIRTGNVWTCPTAGTNAGLWVQQTLGNHVQFADGAVLLPPSACVSSVSGNSTGTNGLTVAGASNTPVMQADTSNTGTNTHTYVCDLSSVATRLNTKRTVQITDATFLYGVQTSALGTQAATLASGTMNSSLVFSYINFPVAGASETASTVTPVRADSGSLTITPAVASFNTATTTAGAFYSVKFTPASPIAVNTDLQQLLLTVTLQNASTSATITNSPGVLVHYTLSPE